MSSTSEKTLNVFELIVQNPGLRQVDYARLLKWGPVDVHRHIGILVGTGWIHKQEKRYYEGEKIRKLFGGLI